MNLVSIGMFSRAAAVRSSYAHTRPKHVCRFLLLGPPVKNRNRNKPPLCITTATNHPSAASQQQQTTVVQDPFMDLMMSNFNQAAAGQPQQQPSMGYTENRSPTYLSTGNPCLHFFFHVVPDTQPESIKQRLSDSWGHDPLTTLKLICNLRGVRGTGKSDREGFYTAANWLHQHHPKTLACNVPCLAGFGYFKDLPEILYRLLEGPQVRDIQRKELKRKRRKAFKKRNSISRSPVQKQRRPVPREVRIQGASRTAEMEMEMEKASAARKEKRAAMAKKLILRYTSDPDYKFLYDRISDFFAECLKTDLQYLNSDDVRKISLAAKWSPSLDSSFDMSTLLCEGIARKVFPRESYPEYEGIEEAHYAYRVRERLRKEILVPLRKVLELPEVYMSANRWDSLPYNRVPSVAMKLYKDKFLKHDKERFSKYLEDVGAGKAKIAAGALLPHDIVREARNGDQVAELQWKRMVDDLLQEGKLKNCIAVCDVSGSMSGRPMEVCVALGLLVSELSEEPWKGKVITFSENPELQMVRGESLMEKASFVEEMEWGMNTNFQRVFDLILQVAVRGNLKEEQMIKRVLVFSDMEFDEASSNPWETDYQVIVRKFTEKGYGKAIPEIVFWNLRDSDATPVLAKQQGVALVSGFSKNLMKLFFNGDGVIDPEAVMELAISGEEYQKLAVID